MLSTYEELLLLSIHEDKGTFIKSAVEKMNPGLIGAVLAELALQGKIQTTENHRLKLQDSTPTGDELLDEVLEELKGSDKERKIGYWINELNPKPDKLRKNLIERLIQKGIVIQEDDHLLWVIPSPSQPEKNASEKYWIKRRLRSIVLAQDEAEQNDIALLSLISACDLLDLIFVKDERRIASRHIHELIVSRALKDPIDQTLEEIETAIAVVVEDD